MSRTPNTPSGLPPRKAMSSFDNLVVLANYQEALRDARKMVWRDRGEPAAELHTLKQCLKHAARGGLRAGSLGFMLRSGFNIFVLLFRIWRAPKHFRFSLIRHALLGQDSFRFGAMLGTFAALYKFILNSLPVLFPYHSTSSPFSPIDSPSELPLTIAPTISERRRGRLSFRAQIHEAKVRKYTRRWYAAFAGAVAGGLAVLFEKKGRRVTIAQQLFVRGLQGTYNALSTKYNFSIPHGDAIVFALCCGQIMYGFTLRPDIIPKSYYDWILNASKVAPASVLVNRTLVRDGKFDTNIMETLLTMPNATSSNKADMTARILRARTGDFGPHYGPCSAVHPWLDSCLLVEVDRFFAVAKWMFPIYGALHFVPSVLFKPKVFMESPLRILVRALLGTMRSSAFLGAFVCIYQSTLCVKNNIYQFLTSSNSPLPIHLREKYASLFITKPVFWLAGLFTGFALFVEEKRRRSELAMYVLPKGLEGLWTAARGRGYLFPTGEYGEAFLCAIGMGMVMHTYQHDPKHLSGLVRRILYQFVGPN